VAVFFFSKQLHTLNHFIYTKKMIKTHH